MLPSHLSLDCGIATKPQRLARPNGFADRRCSCAAHSGSLANGSQGGNGAGSTKDGSASQRPAAPWTLTFDLRERDTLWTETNQSRLVRIVAGYQLDMDVQEVEQRLEELAVLLPQLAARCAYIRPSTLAQLLREPSKLVPRLLSLRKLLPSSDINALAAAEPEMVLLRELEALQADLARLRELLGEDADLEAAIQRQPRFLDAQLVSEVLDELRRLVPAADPVKTLLGDPSWLLRVERGQKRLGDDPD